MKMPLHFADLGPSGLARRYGAVETEDEPTRKLERLEAARKAAAPVTNNVTNNPPVTKSRGRPRVAAPLTAAERKRASRERQKAKVQP